MNTRVSTILHSVGTKVVVILLAMASTTAAALMIGTIETRSIADRMTKLAADQVPAVRDSVAILAAFAAIRAELTDYILAADSVELQEHHGELAAWDDDVPYENDLNWGLADRPESEIAERVWRIK